MRSKHLIWVRSIDDWGCWASSQPQISWQVSMWVEDQCEREKWPAAVRCRVHHTVGEGLVGRDHLRSLPHLRALGQTVLSLNRPCMSGWVSIPCTLPCCGSGFIGKDLGLSSSADSHLQGRHEQRWELEFPFGKSFIFINWWWNFILETVFHFPQHHFDYMQCLLILSKASILLLWLQMNVLNHHGYKWGECLL